MLSNCGAREDSSGSLGLQKRSNQSIVNEINPEYLLGGLMLKLKLQYFGHLLGRADSLEKTAMLEKIDSRRRRANRGWDGWMASLTQWTWVQVNSRRWWRTGKPGVLQSMGPQRVRHAEQTNNNIAPLTASVYWNSQSILVELNWLTHSLFQLFPVSQTLARYWQIDS